MNGSKILGKDRHISLSINLYKFVHFILAKKNNLLNPFLTQYVEKKTIGDFHIDDSSDIWNIANNLSIRVVYLVLTAY